MLTGVLAHAGQAVEPHDLWGAWNVDPLLVAGLAIAVWLYRRGAATGPPSRRRQAAFAGGVAAVAVALVSPLEAMSAALASAHMVQHVLLTLVSAPLFALAAPGSTLLRGSPPAVRRATGRWRRQLRLTRRQLRVFRDPVAVWVLHVGALWVWHASVLYTAAVRSWPLHVAEHTSFVVTGVLFWRVVVGARSVGAASHGTGLLLVFAMALQSVFLSLLLTFAQSPWYEVYGATAPLWGLDPLADQQLAGVIMWVPAGAVYVAAGLLLLSAWIRGSERDAAPSSASGAQAPLR